MVIGYFLIDLGVPVKMINIPNKTKAAFSPFSACQAERLCGEDAGTSHDNGVSAKRVQTILQTTPSVMQWDLMVL